MSALTFTLREAPPERLDLSPLVPRRLSGLAPREIECLEVGTTRTGIRVGDVFRLSGDDPAALRFDGGSTRFDRLGEELAAGSIRVEGDVGARLGFAMAGGVLVVTGSLTGPYGATAMTGGLVRVAGHVADATAAALPGTAHGMAGGTLIVGGRAGEMLADRMGGGLLLVAGGAEGLAGSRMSGGTIVAAGLGRRAGQGMVGGRIVTGAIDGLEPTFVSAGEADPALLASLRAAVAAIAGGAFARLVPSRAESWRGDMADGGDGEIAVGD